MRVGMVGCGKLGLPVILAIESKGHEVMGYDVNPAIQQHITDKHIPYKEEGLQPLLDDTKILFAPTIEDLVAWADIVFVAIQTPHEPEYEGATPLPATRKDFNYDYLLAGIDEIANACLKQQRRLPVAVISTCLPSTFRTKIERLMNPYVSYVYTPQFIAMGTVVVDYLNPEFNLIGVYDEPAAGLLRSFYKTINHAPCLVTDITTAEAIKVSYNTFITMKTVLANTWGELCQRVGANVDDLYEAWSLSTRRLLSSKYLRAGMGDGGGCHPRDNIALSWLAEQVGLSHNIFEDLMSSREDHARWLADNIVSWARFKSTLPVIVLGRSFKPETDITTGSPALLVAAFLGRAQVEYTHVESLDVLPKAIYFLATAHERYKIYAFPPGSVVIDPFRMIQPIPNVILQRVGDGT